MAEGSMRENLDKAAYYRPSNLTPIIDVNRLGQRGPTKAPKWSSPERRAPSTPEPH